MNQAYIYLHHFESCSYANGPGCRAVIWTQGCSLRCPGCFNPQTHPFDKNTKTAVSEIWQKIDQVMNKIEGITITGGEPFDQPEGLYSLLSHVKKESNLSIIVFSGYEWIELITKPIFAKTNPLIDLLITGRFIDLPNTKDSSFIQPHKSYYFFTNRYNRNDLTNVPPAEVIITASGQVLLSGTNPIVW